MKMNHNFKISFNFSKSYSKAIILALIFIFIFIFRTLYLLNDDTHSSVEEYNTNEIFKLCTIEIESCFNHYYGVAKNYNFLFHNYQLISNSSRRNFYNAVTQYIISNNKDINALWVDFDENKFDNLDAYYKNTEYYSEEGRFNLCWYRENNKVTKKIKK